MANPYVATFSDIIDAMEDFMAGQNTAANQQVIRRAILSAYREVISARDWKCLVRNGRIHLHAAQTTGTITYTHSTRTVTLSGATWPSWAVDAAIRIDDIVCDVESVSGLTLILDATMNPGADIAAGTTYTLYPRWYVLPAGFVSMSGPMTEGIWSACEEISPTEMFARQRFSSSAGTIRWYSIAAIQDLYGSMGLYVDPPSDADETLDFTYKCRPRDLRYSGEEAADSVGTISIGASSAAITGLSTAFTAAHVGSIMRISSNSTKPTGYEGNNPYVEQRSIIACGSPTNATLDAAVETARTAVKYVISDPIDLDVSLFDVFMRCCEKQIVLSRKTDNRTAFRAYEDALFAAKCADGRSTARKVVGGGGVPSNRFRYFVSDLTGDTVD